MLCTKIKGGIGWRGKNGVGGWYWFLDSFGAAAKPPEGPRPPRPKLSPAAVADVVRRSQSAISNRRLDVLGRQLGLSRDSLRRLRVGWLDGYAIETKRMGVRKVYAYAFPMCRYEEVGGRLERRYVGIRIRDERGNKFSLPGGDEGLFVPEGLPKGCPLALPEGPTSTAACLDLGVPAVGRSNNLGGGDELLTVLSRVPQRDVAVVGDRDPKVWVVFLKDFGRKAAGEIGEVPRPEFPRLERDGVVERLTSNGPDRWPGRDGALALAERLAPVCRSVMVAIPPVKDVREWLRQGATREDLVAILGKPFERYL